MNGPDMMPEGKYIVPALTQGLSVLGLFSRERPVLAPPDIARELNLSRATVFRLLHTLETMGYLQRDINDRQYRLGPAVLGRGFAYLASLDLVEVAQPALRKLRDDTGMSSHLVMRDRREVVYLARFPAHSALASSVQVGTRFPVHGTILGRMLICELDDTELRELFPEPNLPRFSEQTPKTLPALKKLLKEDRDRGYAVSQSFFERGISAIAAPLRDNNGRIVAAINVTAVDTTVAAEEMAGRLKDLVLAAARTISSHISSEQALARTLASAGK
ncbi:IclR family transcriptional regulator [Methylocella sp. CPCC 101449]|uniref:IclR family transcriptional regulator n=1 Tax=Methylocella sp. CPCC 101449 TaxID=2987531 RepID=UPI0028901333|nr:IclR family transcriptional regulator [Methylocella sp. CPCC 101449]MDT2022650.1 IclR family transcriptional regulator [Methylocella sp. CPCC 101449]HEV2572624.1 IclR family transcriptional regulator [Beijerinckiaceae bacterium]